MASLLMKAPVSPRCRLAIFSDSMTLTGNEDGTAVAPMRVALEGRLELEGELPWLGEPPLGELPSDSADVGEESTVGGPVIGAPGAEADTASAAEAGLPGDTVRGGAVGMHIGTLSGARSSLGQWAKKHTRRGHARPSLQSCVR